MTAKGKRTLTASLIMVGSGSVLGVYFKEGLLYALVAIFVFSSLGVLFEIYSGYRAIERQKDLKERMKQTLEVDHLKTDGFTKVSDNKTLEPETIPEETNELPDKVQRGVDTKTSVVVKEDTSVSVNQPEVRVDVSRVEDSTVEVKPIKAFKPFGEFKGNDSIARTEIIEKIEEKVVNVEEVLSEQTIHQELVKEESLVYEAKEETQKNALEQKNEMPLYRKMIDLINGIKNDKAEWSFDLKLKCDDESFTYIDYLLISEKGIMVINDMLGYEVISGNSELHKWNCYKTKGDYNNQHAISIENPSKELNKAVGAIKKILIEFDLLLPIYSTYMVQDNCELFVTESSSLEVVELNQYTEYLGSKNDVPDITSEMVSILKEIFDIKNETSTEG